MKPVELLCANSGLMHFSFTFQTRKLRLYFIHQWRHYKTDLSFNSNSDGRHPAAHHRHWTNKQGLAGCRLLQERRETSYINMYDHELGPFP